jgi:hypothetical protein
MSVSAALAPPQGPAGNSSAVASATNTCSTGTFTRQSGPLGGIYLLAAYNGDFVTNPATDASFGGQALGLLVGENTTLGNVSVEIWGSTGITSSSGVATINFAGGSVLDIILFVIEIDYVGNATAPSNASGSAFGTTSPITVSIATSSVSGGRKATVVVDSVESILIGIGALFRAASGSNMAISVGTQFHAPLNAGAGGLQIQAATAWTQGTGGTDEIAWTESVNREWAEVTIQICGAAHDGMILRPGGAVLPALF